MTNRGFQLQTWLVISTCVSSAMSWTITTDHDWLFQNTYEFSFIRYITGLMVAFNSNLPTLLPSWIFHVTCLHNGQEQ